MANNKIMFKEGNYALVERFLDDGSFKEYVVATNPVSDGTSWGSGIYYTPYANYNQAQCLADAMQTYMVKTGRQTHSYRELSTRVMNVFRLEEIATKALDRLEEEIDDDDEFYEFVESELELNDRERNFFEIKKPHSYKIVEVELEKTIKQTVRVVLPDDDEDRDVMDYIDFDRLDSTADYDEDWEYCNEDEIDSELDKREVDRYCDLNNDVSDFE